MTPGSRWVYRETDADGEERRADVMVTRWTKTVLGVEARIVRDVVTEHRRIREITDDWFAQDTQGNIWHLGEAGREFCDGRARTTRESWQAGVDGTRATVPYGSFDHLVITRGIRARPVARAVIRIGTARGSTRCGWCRARPRR